MELGLMMGAVGKIVTVGELRSLGFSAVQAFFGHGPEGDAQDPTAEDLDAVLRGGNVALAAMTLHVDLVDAHGARASDVGRAMRCVEKTAALDGRYGRNVAPVLIWHPSAYPEGDAPNVDSEVHEGLCEALGTVCRAAELHGVLVAVEITRAGSIGSAEAFLRVRDCVDSAALRVCLDAANFTPDRTPLDRAVRVLGSETAIVHGKDVRFAENGEVAAYGPTGSGTLDYAAYVGHLRAHVDAPYLVLEYYRTRDELLRARDVVVRHLV